MAANYNLPTSRNETCKFDLKTTVKVIREQTPGELFGPVKKGGLSRVQKKKAGKKKKGGKRSKAGCKGRNKNKWKCRNKGRKPKNKKKPQLKLVKSLQLKVCTRYRERGNTSSAIMDIGILNGFGPDLKSLQNLQTTLPEMDKYEVSYRSLVIYLSKVPSHRALCVDVQFDRLYDVGMVQAVPVKVYHYEPDESCSVFYELDKTKVLPLGVCDVGSRYCKCINDNGKCAPQDPPIGNIDSLINIACTMYHYAIKGKVLLITRNRDGMIEYVVDVLQIIQQGNKVLKLGQRIELLKHRDCVWSPDLKELEDYLFMGLEKGDRYSLDGSSFVKLWPKRPANNKDKVILENFAAQYTC